MSWLSQFLNPGESYNKAGETEKGYYNEAQGYRQPYMDFGQTSGNSLQDMMNKLMHPEQLQEEWGKNYKTSDYAKQMLEENKGQGLDAAASMGLVGSSPALQNIQRGAGDIVSKDRQQYMDDLMKKFMTSIGIGENMFGVGAQTAGQAAEGAQREGENQAGWKYGADSSRNNMIMKLLPMIIAAMGGKGGGTAGGGGGGWADPGSVPMEV